MEVSYLQSIKSQGLIIVFWIGSFLSGRAQGGILGPNNTPVDYTVKDCYDSIAYRKVKASPTLRPNYIFKGQRVWRSISLDHKGNRNVLNAGGKCAELGLFEIIKFGLLEKNLHAFKTDDPASKNTLPITRADLLQLLQISSIDTIVVFNANGEESREVNSSKQYLMGKDIRSFVLKEDWVLNSLTGKQEKHVIALAPLIYDVKTDMVLPLFWLYYPEWEALFGCFEAKNFYTRERITYRDVLTYKYFVSKVDKSSNLFNRDFKTEHRGENNVQKDETLKEDLNNGETDLFPN